MDKGRLTKFGDRYSEGMSFELFTSSRAASSEPFISLVKEGFRFSASFARAHHLDRATVGVSAETTRLIDRTRGDAGLESLDR